MSGELHQAPRAAHDYSAEALEQLVLAREAQLSLLDAAGGDLPPGDHPNAPGNDPTGRPPAAPRLPAIRISVEMTEVVDRAERALHAKGGVYVRGRHLAQVVRDYSAPAWLKLPDGIPLIDTLGNARLRELMSSSARWEKFNARSEEWVPSLPPEWAPATLQERGQWQFPVLEGISDIPVLRPDGTIHDRPGYDERSRIIYDPDGRTWPAIEHQPTHHDAVTALAELCEPFCDFPFVERWDMTAAIAFLLSIVGRSAIAGPVPMFMSGSTTPGTGKGLIADVVGIIATGRDSPKMAPTRDDAETRKRLLPIALAAPGMLTFDNVEGLFGSETLAMILTTGQYMDRILGESKNVEIPFRTVLAVTGNGIQLQGDLGRRVIPITIDARMEHPEDRTGFRYPNLKEHVATERAHFVVAALTLLRGYVAAGMPTHGLPVKGSYEAWDRLVRGAIIWAGGADPAAGVQRLREDGDIDLERLRALIGAWRCIPVLEATAAELMDYAKMSNDLQLAIDAYALKGQPMDATRLGLKLAQLAGRICDGYRIEKSGMNRSHSRLWKLVEMQ